jgi:hypothetical protein
MPNNITGQDRRIMRDVTVMSVANAPAGGGALGTPASYLGVIETVEIELKREYADTTASADLGQSGRAVRWGLGSVKLTGYSAATSSLFVAQFAAGGHAQFLFTEIASGDAYQLMCRTETVSKSLGKEATKDTLSLVVEGQPFYTTAAGTLAALPLE